MDQSQQLKHQIRMHQLGVFLSWLLNSGLFYLGWVLTIKFILEDKFWQGPVINLAIIALHVARVPNKLLETALIACFCLLGTIVDTSLAYFDIIHYEGRYECCPWLAPAWITSLWALFATSINHSLSWVGKSLWISILVGAVGGTFSYMTAIQVGAAHFLVPTWVGIAILVAIWAVVMPFCFVLNDFLKRALGEE